MADDADPPPEPPEATSMTTTVTSGSEKKTVPVGKPQVQVEAKTGSGGSISIPPTLLESGSSKVSRLL